MKTINKYVEQIISPLDPPEPLESPTFQKKVYPIAALGDVLAPMALTMNRVIKAPLDLCAQSVLMTAALAAQGFKNVEIDGRTIPLSLFALSIGQSGERKSAVDKIASAPIANWEREQQESYAISIQQYKQDKKAFDHAEQNTKKKLKSEINQAVIKTELEKLGTPPRAPLSPKLRSVDATVEGLQKHLKTALPLTGIYTDEGSVFFGGYSMSSEKAAKTIGLYSMLWDGSPVDMVRSNDEAGAFTLYDRRLSIHLMIQPVIAKKVVSDPLLMQQGFIPRFLISEPESTMGSRLYENIDIKETPDFKRYFTTMKNLIDLGFFINDDGSLDLLPLSPVELAKAEWVKFHDEIEKQLSKNGELRHVSGTAAKIAEQALRIAGVLTVINSKNKAQHIQLSEMKSGIELARYSLHQLLFMLEKYRIDDIVEDARNLLAWIAKNKFEYVYPSLDANKRPQKLRPKKIYAKAIQILYEHNYLEFIGDLELDGRKRKEVYKVLHNREPDS